jgi:hypothetical protein
MYELKKKIGKLFTSKFVGIRPASYEKKRIYRAAVSQRLKNTVLVYSDGAGVVHPATPLMRSALERILYLLSVG